jgi:type II secretory pathway pseudopilin PulG
MERGGQWRVAQPMKGAGKERANMPARKNAMVERRGPTPAEGRLPARRVPKVRSAGGFTLIELAIATVVLLVGILAVMKLVPAAMRANRNSRFDTTALVIAQRQLDEMISQPLASGQFVDSDGRAISLGGSVTGATPVVFGGPVITAGPWTRIDFTAPAVAGYNYLYTDPNSSAGPVYEVRWAVVVRMIGTAVASKRFVVGVWKRDPTQVTLPVTLDAWVKR